MSLLKMNGKRYTVHFYDFYGFGEMGDITQLIGFIMKKYSGIVYSVGK
jgi:hypothetical protein